MSIHSKERTRARSTRQSQFGEESVAKVDRFGEIFVIKRAAARWADGERNSIRLRLSMRVSAILPLTRLSAVSHYNTAGSVLRLCRGRSSVAPFLYSPTQASRRFRCLGGCYVASQAWSSRAPAPARPVGRARRRAGPGGAAADRRVLLAHDRSAVAGAPARPRGARRHPHPRSARSTAL